MPYRVAIAGCHRMTNRPLAGHNFAAAFAAVPATAIVAVFDYGAQTRAEFVACWGDLPAYDNYAGMVQEVKPDLLCIATRQTMHADQIAQAVAAGVRGILCDKPLATTLAEADRIRAACHAHKVPLLFALDRRWMAPYRYLREAIANGIIGAVTSVTAHGVPNLVNHGCHWIDTALMLVGDPEPLWVSGRVADLATEPPDSRRRLDPPGWGQVGLSNGALLNITPDGGRRPAFTVFGEQGRLLILNDGEEVYQWLDDSGLQRLAVPATGADWPAGPAMVMDLINALETGSATHCDLDHARRATEVSFAIHLSHTQNGRRITLPATDRTLAIPSFPWGNEGRDREIERLRD